MGHGIGPGELVPGETVSIITESDHPEWPVGTRVRAPVAGRPTAATTPRS